MSATRDPSQKITFLFTPMGKLVRKIRNSEPAPSAAPPAKPPRSRILKSSDLREPGQRPGLVRDYRAREIRETPAHSGTPAIPAALAATDLHLGRQRQALRSMAKNLEELQQIEKRLQFMLLELEELLKD